MANAQNTPHGKPLAAVKPGGTRVILVRHGETDWNKAKRYQGHTDIALNSRGLAQAKALAKRFQHEAWLQVDHAYSSDLQRAWVTATTLLGSNADILTATAGLRERNFGIMAGLTADEMQTKSAEVFHGIQNRLTDAPIPKGESLQMLFDRVITEFKHIVAKHLGKQILLVAHGGVLDCIYRHCTEQPLHTPRAWPLPNAALNIIDFCPEGSAHIKLWADLTHETDALLPQSLDEVDTRVA